MIQAEKLSKYYGSNKALDQVSFNIEQGEIIGFLGHNGAGKTTLMRILTSYLPQSEGKLLINGQDIRKNSLPIRKRIGYLPETPPLYPSMAVSAYLKFAAELNDIPHKDINSRIDRVISQCNLESVRTNIISELSKGFKQRVGIAQAIINEPELLILDEPTVGLDPEQVQQVRSLIRNLENKTTVILSTHILSEIEQLVRRVFVIRKGKIILDQSLDVLKGITGETKKVRLVVKGDWAKVDAIVDKTLKGKQSKMERDEDLLRIEFDIKSDLENFNKLAEQLQKEEISIIELSQKIVSLEDAYLNLIENY